MQRAHNLSLFALVAIGLAAGTGCASNGPYAHGPSVSETNSVTLRVRNKYWQDVRVYVLQGGSTPVRIGYVNGLSTRLLRIRTPLSGHTQLLLRPLGTRVSIITDAVNVHPGELLELTVQNSLNQTTLIRR